MASKAKATKGTKLMMGDGAEPEVFTAIAEVYEVSGGPKREVGEIDVTSFDSTDKEFISDGMADGGTISAKLRFIGDTQQKAIYDSVGGPAKNFKLLVNDAALDANKTTFAFTAFPKKYELASPSNNAYDASLDLRVTGTPTFTVKS